MLDRTAETVRSSAWLADGWCSKKRRKRNTRLAVCRWNRCLREWQAPVCLPSAFNGSQVESRRRMA